MLYKTLRERNESEELLIQNPRLFELLHCLNIFVELEMGKTIMVTSIYRSQEEQDSLYKEVPLEKRPKRSPHQDWKAVDLRSKDFTDQEIKRIVAFCNQFKYQNGTRVTALYHTIAGNVNHLHIQYE